MADFSLWLNPLTSRIQGGSAEQIRAEFLAACRDFYLQSRAWNTTLGPFSTVASDPVVTLTPADPQSRVGWVRGVWLQYGTMEEPLAPMVRKLTTPREDHPCRFYRDLADPANIHLWPTPDASETDELYANVALIPATTATTLPTVAELYHFDGLLNTAMGRLLMMPNKPWTDGAAGLIHAQKGRRAALEFRAVADAGYTHSDPPWRFPPFA